MKPLSSKQSKRLYEFGPFRLDPEERLLLRNQEIVTLTHKAFDTLVVLIENSGRLLEKDDLMRAVWPDTFVDENTLTSNISTLRKALGQSNGDQYIETVPKRGYRFVANVTELQLDAGDLLVQKRTRSRLVIRDETEETEEDAIATRPVDAALRRPDERRTFSSAAVVLAAIAVIAIAGAVYMFNARHSANSGGETARASRPEVRSVAVLPFKTIGADSNDEYLGLGMTDVLINRLGHLSRLAIRPTSAVLKYGGLAQDAVAAGRELNVDAVLDGRLQRSGDRVRVTVELLSVKDGAPLWAEEFDGYFKDLFTVQDSISERVGRAVIPNFTAEQRELLTKRETENPEAYQAFLKGRYFWNKRTTENFSKATDYFQQAVDLDPGYAQAYVGLAHCYSFRADWGTAKKHLEKALELDDTLADAHAALAFVFRFCREWDFAGTEKEFRRAIELNPNYATGHQWYAYYLASMDRFDEAIREINEAHDLDPLSINVNTDKGEILYFSRRYDEAMAAYRSSLEMDNNFMLAHYLLGTAYEQKAMYGEAVDEYQKALALVTVDDYPHLKGFLGRAYALMGRRDEAVKILNELKKAFAAKAPGAAKIQLPFAMALICAAVGDKDQAFVWLEKGVEYHGYEMIEAKMDPRYDSLRSDSRFTDLLRRVGLPS